MAGCILPGLRALLAAVLLIGAAPAAAQQWSALAQDEVVAVMRHALAPGTGDPARFDLSDCTTQRNLDDRGRAQARATGAALRQAGIGFDAILSSEWCRCRETAGLLGLGPVTPAPELNSFFGDRSSAADQTAAVREVIDRAPGRLLLVTHQVNITALTGLYPKSGEILVLKRTADGLALVDRLMIAP